MQETWVWFLGWEDPLEEEMVTHSSILAWEIPWKSLMDSSPWGHKRLRYNLVTKQEQHSTSYHFVNCCLVVLYFFFVHFFFFLLSLLVIWWISLVLYWDSILFVCACVCLLYFGLWLPWGSHKIMCMWLIEVDDLLFQTHSNHPIVLLPLPCLMFLMSYFITFLFCVFLNYLLYSCCCCC